MFNGLRRRPKYEEISQEINPDRTKIIYPNRDAKFLREDPRMTQLDGLGFFESMQEQQESITKEQRKETIIQDIAKEEATGVKEVKAKPKEPEVFNMAEMDHEEGTYDHPMAEHEQAIMEAREMSKRKRRTKKEMAEERVKQSLKDITNKAHDLVDKERQREKEMELNKRRIVPPEETTPAFGIYPPPPPPPPAPKTRAKKQEIGRLKKKEEEIKKEEKDEPKDEVKSESDKPPPPQPKRRGRPTKKDLETKEKPNARRTKKEEMKEADKKEEMKKEEDKGLATQETRGRTRIRTKVERSRSRDAKSQPKSEPKSEKSETKSEPKSERSRSRGKSEPKSEPKDEPMPKAKAKAKGRPKKDEAPSPIKPAKKEKREDTPDIVRASAQIARLEEKQNRAKKNTKEEPEAKHEPKGSRGRPRSSQPSSSSAQPSVFPAAGRVNKPTKNDGNEIFDTQSMTVIKAMSKTALLNQLKMRGFQGKKMTELKKRNKEELLDFIDKLIEDDRW